MKIFQREKNIKKNIKCILLALAFVFTLFSFKYVNKAQAVEYKNPVTVCEHEYVEGICTRCHNHGGDNPHDGWAPISSLPNKLEYGKYYLTQDIVVDLTKTDYDYIKYIGQIDLCFNGHTIQFKLKPGTGIGIFTSYDIYFYDCVGTGGFQNNTSDSNVGICVFGNRSINVFGGIYKNNVIHAANCADPESPDPKIPEIAFPGIFSSKNGNLNVYNATFENNSTVDGNPKSTRAGTCLTCLNSTARVYDSTFTNNTGTADGCCLNAFSYGGKVTIDPSTRMEFVNNTVVGCSGYHGSVYADNCLSSYVENCTFKEVSNTKHEDYAISNPSVAASALSVSSPLTQTVTQPYGEHVLKNVSVYNSWIEKNQYFQTFGMVGYYYMNKLDVDNLTIVNCKNDNNEANAGLNVYDANTVNLSNSVFKNNSAGGGQTAVIIEGVGDVIVDNCLVKNNIAGYKGVGQYSGCAGIFVSSKKSASVKNCEIIDNKCLCEATKGVGLYMSNYDDTTVTSIENCMIKGNCGTGDEVLGGGVYLQGTGIGGDVFEIRNVTITENEGGEGSGIFVSAGKYVDEQNKLAAKLNLYGVTVANNTSKLGGAFRIDGYTDVVFHDEAPIVIDGNIMTDKIYVPETTQIYPANLSISQKNGPLVIDGMHEDSFVRVGYTVIDMGYMPSPYESVTERVITNGFSKIKNQYNIELDKTYFHGCDEGNECIIVENDDGELAIIPVNTKSEKCNVNEKRSLPYNVADFKAWEKGDTLPVTSGKYYLTSDVELLETYIPVDGIQLYLNGYDIIMAGKGSVIHIKEGVTFTLYDKYSADGGAYKLFTDRNGESGEIKGGSSDYGGGVLNEGTFYFYGGKITGNNAQYGGGIYNTGSLVMKNALVIQNTAEKNAGGVYNQSESYKIIDSTVRENNLKLVKTLSIDASAKIEGIDIVSLYSPSLIGYIEIGELSIVDEYRTIISGNIAGSIGVAAFDTSGSVGGTIITKNYDVDVSGRNIFFYTLSDRYDSDSFVILLKDIGGGNKELVIEQHTHEWIVNEEGPIIVLECDCGTELEFGIDASDRYYNGENQFVTVPYLDVYEMQTGKTVTLTYNKEERINVGTYEVTMLIDGVSYQSATFNVLKVPLKIKVNDATVDGNSIYVPNYTVTGLFGSDTQDEFLSNLRVVYDDNSYDSPERESELRPGVNKIKIDGSFNFHENQNYDVIYESGLLTVYRIAKVEWVCETNPNSFYPEHPYIILKIGSKQISWQEGGTTVNTKDAVWDRPINGPGKYTASVEFPDLGEYIEVIGENSKQFEAHEYKPNDPGKTDDFICGWHWIFIILLIIFIVLNVLWYVIARFSANSIPILVAFIYAGITFLLSLFRHCGLCTFLIILTYIIIVLVILFWLLGARYLERDDDGWDFSDIWNDIKLKWKKVKRFAIKTWIKFRVWITPIVEKVVTKTKEIFGKVFKKKDKQEEVIEESTQNEEINKEDKQIVLDATKESDNIKEEKIEEEEPLEEEKSLAEEKIDKTTQENAEQEKKLSLEEQIAKLDSELAEEDNLLSQKDFFALAKSLPPVACPEITKATIREHLSTSFGEDVEINARANYIRSGVLPLADTHYTLLRDVDGEKQRIAHVCFVYVYEFDNGRVAMLLKASDEQAQDILSKHENIRKSAFPKSKKQWYAMVADDSWSAKEAFEMLDDVKAYNEQSSGSEPLAKNKKPFKVDNIIWSGKGIYAKNRHEDGVDPRQGKENENPEEEKNDEESK